VSRLFVNLYLDEDVDVLLAALVRSRGLVAFTTREAGQGGATDEGQLAYAAERRMAILTHNRGDFEALAAVYRQQGRPHSGVIIAVRRTPHEIVARLLPLLNDVSAEEMDNQVYYI
jgi:predicted nuclease of predicted toxin-antitoxin system